MEPPRGPFPPGAGCEFRWPVPAATQCYHFRATATSGHTCTANSCCFFAFQLTVASRDIEAKAGISENSRLPVCGV